MPFWQFLCMCYDPRLNAIDNADDSGNIFSAGYVVAAIFICAEYQRLGIAFRHYRILAISFWVKLAFIIVEVALAIGKILILPLVSISWLY